MSQNRKFIHKSYNVMVLLYHLVSRVKYHRVVISDAETCAEIEKRYEVRFSEVYTDRDHVHFLIQSVPSYSVTKIVTMLKSLLAREVFRRCREVKKHLWGGDFWGKGYFVNTVFQHGAESVIAKYIKEQGVEKEYNTLKKDHQLKLF